MAVFALLACAVGLGTGDWAAAATVLVTAEVPLVVAVLFGGDRGP